jgi:hypothetical protein
MSWVVNMSFPDGTCPFKLERKVALWRSTVERQWRQRIVRVERVDEEECVCISVDAPDQLYVTSDYLVTHNSTTLISTAAKLGTVYVINADGKRSSLKGAKRRTRDFEHNLVTSWSEMEEALLVAKVGVRKGKYKTIIIDTLSSFGMNLEQECLAATDSGKGPDGRRAYPDYERRLRYVVESCFQIPAHFIAISHFLTVSSDGGTSEGAAGAPKSGDGIVPLLAGKARATIPLLFDDVLFFDYRKGERILVVNPQGAWGPGSRSLEGSDTLPADVGRLVKEMKKQAEVDVGEPIAKEEEEPEAEAQEHKRPERPARDPSHDNRKTKPDNTNGSRRDARR